MSDPTPNTTHFDESLRYTYPLTPDSRVLDLGFYKGDFATRIADTHGCQVEAWEPIQGWYEQGLRRLAEGGYTNRVHLYHGAVGVWNGSTRLVIKGDSTGAFADPDGRETQVVPLFLIDDLLGPGCDLLKLNVEGAEFDVLERMCKLGLIQTCADIQIQFHICAPDAVNRHRWIRGELLKTHYLTYDFPWCWENYRRRD